MAALSPKWHQWHITLSQHLGALLESRCAGCERPTQRSSTAHATPNRRSFSWCAHCLNQLHSASHNRNRCPLCGLKEPSHGQHRCPTPWPIEQTLVGADYQESIATVVGQLKFGHQFWAARALAELIVINNPRPEVDLLIPVPLSEGRLLHRGFNQAHEIAKHLQRDWRTAIATHALQKTRETPAQSSLDAQARQRNIQNAYRAHPVVKNLHVALIDDVVTTGATAASAARSLYDAGAQSVTLIAAARTPH